MLKGMINRNTMIIQLVTFLVLLQYSLAQIGCPAINCPANCDVIKGPDGCNRCACSTGNGEQNLCSAVPSCPQGCRQDDGQDGCPVCQCGHNGILCAAVPSCLKGCLSHNNVTGCHTCACSPAPQPQSSSSPLEIGSTGASANSRQRRQLRQRPPLRRVRPNFAPGGVQFRGTQLPFRNRRPAFGSGSFSVAGRPTFNSGSFGVAGSRCQLVNCQQGCRSVIDLYGCRQCICGSENVFCPSVPACYGQCLRNNPNTGCSECTCSLEGISTNMHQGTTPNIHAQQNGASIVSSSSGLMQNANVFPNQQVNLPNASPPSSIGSNIPTNSNAFQAQPMSNTPLSPTSNTNFIPQGPVLNHAANVNGNVPLGQYAPSYSQYPTVQQGFVNPGTQQQGIPNLHSTHFQSGPLVQHTIPNQHVTANAGLSPVITPGNPVPINQIPQFGNSVPTQQANVHSSPTHHSPPIHQAFPEQQLSANTGLVPASNAFRIPAPIPQNQFLGNSVPSQQAHLHSTLVHNNPTVQHTFPGQQVAPNTGLITGAISGPTQLTPFGNPFHTNNAAAVGHLNPTNQPLVPNQNVPANAAFIPGTTSNQVPLNPLRNHHFQNPVPVEPGKVISSSIKPNPTVQQLIPVQPGVTNIALAPGKAFNRIPLKPSGSPDPVWQNRKVEKVVPVKHLIHANPLIHPEMLPQPHETFPSTFLPRPEPQPPHHDRLSQPQKPFPPKYLPRPGLTLQSELSHPEKPPQPHGPIPPKVLHQSEWAPNPELLHPEKPTQPQEPFAPKVPSHPEVIPQPGLHIPEKPVHSLEQIQTEETYQDGWKPQLKEHPHSEKSPLSKEPPQPENKPQPKWPSQHKMPPKSKLPEPEDPYKSESSTKYKENLITPKPEKITTIKPTAKPYAPPSHPKPIKPSPEITKESYKPDEILTTTVKPFIPPANPKPTTTVKPFVPPANPKPTTTVKPFVPLANPKPTTTVKPFVPPANPKPTTTVKPFVPPANPKPTTTVKPFVPPANPKPSTTVKPFVPPANPKPTTIVKPFVPPANLKPTTTVKPFVPPPNPEPNTTVKTFVPPENPKPTTTVKPFVPPENPKPTTTVKPFVPPKPTTTVKPFVPTANPKPTTAVKPFIPPVNPKPTTTFKPFVPPANPKPTTTVKPFISPENPKPTTTVKPFIPPTNPKPTNPSQGTTTSAPLITTPDEKNSGKWIWVEK